MDMDPNGVCFLSMNSNDCKKFNISKDLQAIDSATLDSIVKFVSSKLIEFFSNIFSVVAFLVYRSPFSFDMF